MKNDLKLIGRALLWCSPTLLTAFLLTGCDDCGCKVENVRKIQQGDILQLKLTGERILAVTGDERRGNCWISGQAGISARFPNGSIQCVLPFETEFADTKVEKNLSNLKEQ